MMLQVRGMGRVVLLEMECFRAYPVRHGRFTRYGTGVTRYGTGVPRYGMGVTRYGTDVTRCGTGVTHYGADWVFYVLTCLPGVTV